MGKNSDLCQIQTKMLNQSKGPAVWALRFQEDKILYCKEMLKHLKATKNLDLIEAYAEDIIVKDNNINGIALHYRMGVLLCCLAWACMASSEGATVPLDCLVGWISFCDSKRHDR